MAQFSLQKALQAAAVLLKTENERRMNYMRLLKLLYIADRESVKQTGCPITYDRIVAMDHGPVPSRFYALIMGRDPASPKWARFVVTEHFDVELIKDPGNKKLSGYEIEVLQTVAKERESLNQWGVRDETHDFPEWEKNYVKGTSVHIPLRDTLEAVGRGKDAEAILEEAAKVNRFLALLEKADR